MLSELTNHVWQSTIYALLAALLALAFRQNRAPVRYALWLSASYKFLVPLALLMSLGSRFAWAPAAQTAAVPTRVQFTLMQVSQPFSITLAPAPVARPTLDWVSLAVFGLWACGFTALILLRLRGWTRVRAAISSSTPVNIAAPIEVRSSPGLLEPGIVGLFRPILLLPAGIADRLEPAQFEAVLAHELCHVRRRDDVTSAVHMIVEAVFWFHPLVWWIGARMVEERERACDEMVLGLGSQPHDYAEGILRVCKSYVESPLTCVSGVTGSDLKKRIQAILMGRAASELTLAKKATLAVAALVALTLPVAIGMLGVSRIQAQPQPSTQKFESASIKPCEAFRKGNSLDLSSETFHSECTSLERLMEQAYGLFANGRMNPGSFLEVAGGPAWTRSDLYEIDAKASGVKSRALMNGPMLQALLEDRFKLKLHHEMRAVPVYALTVGTGGPHLQPFEGTCLTRDFDKPPSDADCGTAQGRENGFRLKAATMGDLCAGFSVLLDRPVVDKTGLAGRFDMNLDLSAESPRMLNRPRSLPALSDPTTPQPPILFSAADTAMKKLGLTLQPAESPADFLVIDQVERISRQ